jgi:Carboxyl transferase domain
MHLHVTVLLPLLHCSTHCYQVAHEFADLHDRAGRMKAKGVVRDVLEWGSSREYFYWRVKRRLAENEVRVHYTHYTAYVTAVFCAMLQYSHVQQTQVQTAI